MTGREDLHFLCLRLFWKKAPPNKILSNMWQKEPVNTKMIVDYDPNVPDFIIHFIFISLSLFKVVKGDAFCVTLARMTSDLSYLERSID